jgi:hypothetical protein
VNFQAWVKTHKNEAALGGAGILATLYLAYRSRSKTSSTASALGGVSPLLNGSAASSTYDALTAGGTLATGAPSAGGWQIPTGITRNGSGYVIPGAAGMTEFDTQGNSYEYINSTTELQSLQQSSTPLYYQPSPGIFQQTTGAGLAAGTPLFYKG